MKRGFDINVTKLKNITALLALICIFGMFTGTAMTIWGVAIGTKLFLTFFSFEMLFIWLNYSCKKAEKEYKEGEQ